jgi:hypothetical protein
VPTKEVVEYQGKQYTQFNFMCLHAEGMVQAIVGQKLNVLRVF